MALAAAGPKRGAPRARRQGTAAGVRRRRHRGGRRGGGARGHVQQRSGLHGRHPRVRRAAGARSRWWRRSPRRCRRSAWATPSTRPPTSGRSSAAAHRDRVAGFVDRAASGGRTGRVRRETPRASRLVLPPDAGDRRRPATASSCRTRCSARCSVLPFDDEDQASARQRHRATAWRRRCGPPRSTGRCGSRTSSGPA
jgi:hypothetical protein